MREVLAHLPGLACAQQLVRHAGTLGVDRLGQQPGDLPLDVVARGHSGAQCGQGLPLQRPRVPAAGPDPTPAPRRPRQSPGSAAHKGSRGSAARPPRTVRHRGRSRGGPPPRNAASTLVDSRPRSAGSAAATGPQRSAGSSGAVTSAPRAGGGVPGCAGSCRTAGSAAASTGRPGTHGCREGGWPVRTIPRRVKRVDRYRHSDQRSATFATATNRRLMRRCVTGSVPEAKSSLHRSLMTLGYCVDQPEGRLATQPRRALPDQE
jgi:hypothetical protein